jgi:hypothetical protein
MTRVRVDLWVGDQEDVVSYTVDVDGGVTNTEAAVAAARERAVADGHEDVNLKEMEAV